MKKTIATSLPASRTLVETAALCGLLTLSLTSGIAHAQALNPILPFAPPSVSTIPPNGDVNPYGVAFVPRIPTDGVIQPNDVLVSNFNNSQNLQGTGTTIVRVTPAGQQSLFFQGNAPLGLTAGLGVLSDGIVLVGNLPTADGTSATVRPGSLLAIDRFGRLIGTLSDSAVVNGLWGMAIHDLGNGSAQVFFSNVLAGNIMRLDILYAANGESLQVQAVTTVGSGFNHRTDPAALVLGPSGLYFDALHNVLYAASSADNAVYALAGAGTTTSTLGTGTQLFQDFVHLHGPIDILLAPNGHLLIANSDGSNADPNQPSELSEFTVGGQFIAQYPIDPNNGAAFGLNLLNVGWSTIRVAAVSDNANSLFLWTTILQ
jgi:DNA-binding beta-propeller fold protein YncE